MSKNLLIIFVKNAVRGRVKTRLAATIGDDKALAVYHELLDHSLRITRDLPLDKAVYYSDFVEAQDLWPGSVYQKCVQNGRDLGEKMYFAIQESLEQGYNQVGLIGTDIYELTSGIIQQAFGMLKKNDVVLGPALDGGYYLIGMKKPYRQIFNLKAWSTPNVRKETLEKIRELGLSYGLLPMLNDIDEEADLASTDLMSRIMQRDLR